MRILVVSLSVAMQAAELPIQEVVLYKHGLGYFERAGDIPAGDTARLSFKASEMNDVLKSLTLLGGKISGLRYDASDPVANRLAEFPFKVDLEKPTLSSFLAQLQGARVVVQYGAETIGGTIITARMGAPADERGFEREHIVLLTDAGELRTLDLTAARSVKFEDAALQAQLREYLRIVAASRSQDRRNVYIDSVDSGSRKVVARYITPTPVWKSSYRLIFGDGGEPTLEGWAIVDNTSGEDWSKIRLSLVSGRPISFISALYEPRYLSRPVAGLAEEAAVAPTVHEGAIRYDTSARQKAAGVAGGVVGGIVGAVPSAPPPPARAAAEMLDAPYARQALPSQIATTAGARELGDLFEYRFATPVNVRAGESAMLPFLQQKIGARKLLIYSDHSRVNPMNAAELTNSTGKTLDGGPLTLFDGGVYAGEALMETTKASDKRLVSYAIDLGTRIGTKFASDTKPIREIRAARGIITTRQAIEETRTFTIRNVDNKPKVLIIEQPVRPGYRVVNVKPTESTPNYHRFEVKLPAGVEESFVLTEEREFSNTHMVSNLNSEFLLTFVQNKALSESGRKQLQAIADKKRQIASLEASQRTLETEIQQLTRDQERLRENIRSLNQVSGQQEQVQKYARALATQESVLVSKRDEQPALAQRKQQLESELSSDMATLSF